LLGAWLTCFHFMYYDLLLTVFPFFVLLADPSSYLRPTLFAVVPLAKDALDPEFAHFYRPWISDRTPPPAPWLLSKYKNVWVVNRLVPNILLLLIVIEHFVPRVGLGGTVTFVYGSLPMQASTMHDDEGHVLLYRKVNDLANVRVTTALYDDGQPWDTYAIMALWLWCGLSLLFWPGPATKQLPKASIEDGTPTEIISSTALLS
jgi:arabinofuranan 3-O-arabinosyltransferase